MLLASALLGLSGVDGGWVRWVDRILFVCLGEVGGGVQWGWGDAVGLKSRWCLFRDDGVDGLSAFGRRSTDEMEWSMRSGWLDSDSDSDSVPVFVLFLVLALVGVSSMSGGSGLMMLVSVFWSAGARNELPETAKRSEYSCAARADSSGRIDGS